MNRLRPETSDPTKTHFVHDPSLPIRVKRESGTAGINPTVSELVEGQIGEDHYVNQQPEYPPRPSLRSTSFEALGSFDQQQHLPPSDPITSPWHLITPEFEYSQPYFTSNPNHPQFWPASIPGYWGSTSFRGHSFTETGPLTPPPSPLYDFSRLDLQEIYNPPQVPLPQNLLPPKPKVSPKKKPSPCKALPSAAIRRSEPGLTTAQYAPLKPGRWGSIEAGGAIWGLRRTYGIRYVECWVEVDDEQWHELACPICLANGSYAGLQWRYFQGVAGMNEHIRKVHHRSPADADTELTNVGGEWVIAHTTIGVDVFPRPDQLVRKAALVQSDWLPIPRGM
ncbi:hypothetical protein BT63DRAFT_475951 [Microthyrium microscopicum]|uniref:Uncharacterized protein n=1 Tax=Microthyrium microscopicum TaxID=703497 RepID=A0A6A6UNT1_9PEZI|nr:hypothetical protein BT63DRAFT_475951 [Microthyrium microscopicum]